jgi:hypothetical protein
MVYAFTQDVPIDRAAYERIRQAVGEEPIDGQLIHLCVQRADGSLYYIDVWESKQKCAQAFEERIHPAVDQAFGGVRPTTEPTVEVLDVIDVTGSASGVRAA